MNTHVWTRVLVIAGLVAMLVGAIDPLEGSILILAGTVIAAGGAFLAGTRHRKLLFWAVVLVAIGLAIMVALTAIGGIGGDTGRSMWWAVLLVPYPVGWLLGVAGAVLALVEFYRLRSLPKHALQ